MELWTHLEGVELAGLVMGAVACTVTDLGVRVYRLDPGLSHEFPDGFLETVAEQGAGVRLAFATSASRLRLTVRAMSMAVVGGPEPTSAPFELVVDGQPGRSARPSTTGLARLDPMAGSVHSEPAEPGTVTFDLPGSGEREVELWLPQDQVVVLVRLEADGAVSRSRAPRRPRWVHHGSSISQGAGAETPTGTWPVRAAALAGVDVVNLGLSGNAVLDPFVARTIAHCPADVISIKVGINVINRDCFAERTFGPALHGFLDLIRDAQPATPIILVTALHCALVEDLPGPTVVGPEGIFTTLGRSADVALGRLTLARTRELVASVARRRQDPKLSLVHGPDLYGETDERRSPLPDALHPGPDAHRLAAERFAPHLRAALHAPTAPSWGDDYERN